MDVSTANFVPSNISTLGILSLLQSTTTGKATSLLSSPLDVVGQVSLTPDLYAVSSSEATSSLDSIENASSSGSFTSSTNSIKFPMGASKIATMVSPSSTLTPSTGSSQKGDTLSSRSQAANKVNVNSSSFSNECSYCCSAPSDGATDASDTFLLKTEIIPDFDNTLSASKHASSILPIKLSNSLLTSNCSGSPSNNSTGTMTPSACESIFQLNECLECPSQQASVNRILGSKLTHIQSQSRHLNQHLQLQPQPSSQLFTNVELAASSTPCSNEIRQQLPYNGNNVAYSAIGTDCITTQKAVAFLAGPRERIHVLGNPVEHCPRCQQEGTGSTGWRPHRHIGELKIRYICERNYDDLESNHHFDIPLCPVCNQVLYLYDFNNMLGVSNARRLHKYVLKCANRHVLPLLDLFCQTKKGGERCNANFKLQWCYGTMVKRCEAQKNRDHDLWWVRYKNEWKQRRTIIRYKKDFLSHLSDVQRSLLLGLGSEGEPPPDLKSVLGSTFDALLSSFVGNLNGPKLKKRSYERGAQEFLPNIIDNYEMNPSSKQQRYRQAMDYSRMSLADYSVALVNANRCQTSPQQSRENTESRAGLDEAVVDTLRYVMGTVVLPSPNTSQDNQVLLYLNQAQPRANSAASTHPYTPSANSSPNTSRKIYINSEHRGLSQSEVISPNSLITGTPTPPLSANGLSPVAVSVVGEVLSAHTIS